jgi:hypothetical protein
MLLCGHCVTNQRDTQRPDLKHPHYLNSNNAQEENNSFLNMTNK